MPCPVTVCEDTRGSLQTCMLLSPFSVSQLLGRGGFSVKFCIFSCEKIRGIDAFGTNCTLALLNWRLLWKDTQIFMTWLVMGEKRARRLERRQERRGRQSAPRLEKMCITIREPCPVSLQELAVD